MDPPLDVCWNHGSPDCAANADPPLQVHRLRDDTFILRQNKCTNYEAPFLYLLMGDEKALLVDTGATPQGGTPLPLRATIHDLVVAWERQRGLGPLDLIVAPSHGHGDHLAGDEQFAGQPRTSVVPPTLGGIQSFFQLTDWPDQAALFDLGSRPLSVIPTPGHEATHLAFFDRGAEILLTGDTIYPGYLYVRDWNAYRKSVERLVRWTETRPAALLLGSHIEMTCRPGIAYPVGTTYQPEEHVLELRPRHLAELHAALERLGETPSRVALDDFIIEPVGI